MAVGPFTVPSSHTAINSSASALCHNGTVFVSRADSLVRCGPGSSRRAAGTTPLTLLKLDFMTTRSGPPSHAAAPAACRGYAAPARRSIGDVFLEDTALWNIALDVIP